MRFISTSTAVALFLLTTCWPSYSQHPVATTPHLVGSPADMAGGNAYGRATVANDGSLLGSATYFAGGNNTIKALSSPNGGGSWTVLSPIATGSSNTHDIDNTYILQLPGGRILAAFRNHDTQGKGNYTYYRITVTSSDDGGKSWKFLSQASENPAKPPPNNNGVWEPFLRLTNSGGVQIYYSRENNATDQDLIMSTSTDHGATWSNPVVVIGADKSDARDGMIGIAPNGASGHLLAVFESEQNGTFQVQKSASSDDGNTWGPRGVVYAAPNGLNAQAPQVTNVNGVLVTSFMTNEDTGVGGTSDEAAKIVTSGDCGNTWGNKLTVGQPPSFWPGLCTTGKENFIVIYGTDVVKAQNATLS